MACYMRAVCSICIASLSTWMDGADLNTSLVSQMRLAVPGADQVRVLARAHADSELDVVITLAGTRDWPPGQNEWLWWDDKRILGIFLQRRDVAGIVYKIAVQKGPGDCEVRVERASGADVIVSCRPEKGNLHGRNHKFFYDIQSKALTGQLEYQPFSMPRLFVSEKAVVLVGSDRKRIQALEFDPLNHQSPFHLLKGTVAERWSEDAQASFGLNGVGPASEQVIDVPPRPFRTLRFGPGAQFSLVKDEPLTPDTPATGFKIIERLGKRTKAYPLPRTTHDEFARLRPGQVRNGYTPNVAEFDDEIGPTQVFDGTLWFAKTFYDGEGLTGVGGFGYFDAHAKMYKIYSPPEVVDWSASSMLVEPEALWIGLTSRGEYGDRSGGLLRFDRKTGTCSRLALPDLIYEIVRVGNSLVVATDFGAALIEDGKVRRFMLDQTRRGQLQVSEASEIR